MQIDFCKSQNAKTSAGAPWLLLQRPQPGRDRHQSRQRNYWPSSDESCSANIARRDTTCEAQDRSAANKSSVLGINTEQPAFGLACLTGADVRYWRRRTALKSCVGHSSLCRAMSALGGKADIVRACDLCPLMLPSQPVAATHCLNLSAGVSNCNVFLGRSFNCLAILLRWA